jgi:hypothetical protein
MKIEVSEEDYKFLKDLQNELNTQETDGNAQPVYWQVIETKEVGVPDGCGEPRIYMGDGVCGTKEEAIDRINETIGEYSEETQKDWQELYKSMQLIILFARNSLFWEDWRIVYVDKDNRLTENTGAFFTKRACRNYIDNNRHNLENPHTYAMTALHNKEFERVVNILRTIKL